MKATAKTVRNHNEFIHPATRKATVVRNVTKPPEPNRLNVPAFKAAILQAIKDVLEKQADDKLVERRRQKRVHGRDVFLPDERTISGQLWRMYDKAGRDLTVSGARELAEAAGLNKTSAEISFYNWRKNRAQQHGS